MITHCIYRATCLVTGKVYIGKTKNFTKRKGAHILDSKKPKNKFHRAMKKYGAENFVWDILLESKNADYITAKEVEYILSYDSIDSGYNTVLYMTEPPNNKKNIWVILHESGKFKLTRSCVEFAVEHKLNQSALCKSFLRKSFHKGYCAIKIQEVNFSLSEVRKNLALLKNLYAERTKTYYFVTGKNYRFFTESKPELDRECLSLGISVDQTNSALCGMSKEPNGYRVRKVIIKNTEELDKDKIFLSIEAENTANKNNKKWIIFFEGEYFGETFNILLWAKEKGFKKDAVRDTVRNHRNTCFGFTFMRGG